MANTHLAAIDTRRSSFYCHGGAFPESIDSIKFNAPLDYASQGRCVTAEDYKTFVKGSFQTLKRFLFLVEMVFDCRWELFQLKSLEKFLYQLNQPRNINA